METKLADYGIQNEESDIRAHVCFIARRIYIYATKNGLDAINTGRYQKRPAFTYVNNHKIKTADGYIVPYQHIENCRSIQLPDIVWNTFGAAIEDSTTDKGRQAANIVAWSLENGYFPIRMKYKIIIDDVMQNNGIDIVAKGEARIQVKCDYRGGSKQYGGTGNLYLQVAERNPLKQY
jgi:hypothetical protein